MISEVKSETAPSCPVSELLAERQSRLRFGQTQRYKLGLGLLDLLVLGFCFAGFTLARGGVGWSGLVNPMLLIPMAATVLMLYLVDGYRPGNDFASVGYAAQHVMAVGMAALITVFASFVVLPGVSPGPLGRTIVGFSFLLFLPVSLYYRRALRSRILRDKGESLILFLGGAESAQEFRRDFFNRFSAGRLLVADAKGVPQFLATGDDEELAVAADAPVESLFARFRSQIGGVVCGESVRKYPKALLREIINLRLASVPVFSVESFYEFRLRKIPRHVVKPEWILNHGFRIAHDPVYAHFKRLSDIGAAAFGLIVASPVMAAVALAVKLTDGGPVFFCQPRVGLNKRIFLARKFRTMTLGSEKGDGYTRDNDVRLTRIGGALRKWRLDELPQLWNVLKGDMSLIGPRAEWDRLVADYEQKIPCYHFRHLVKPGITGWAQVNYPYGENIEDTRCKLEYDLFYIRHFSFLLDASIVFKTLNTMLFAKGK